MTDPLTKIWADLETWLKAHSEPALADLRPGASNQDLAALEAELGAPLPEDLRKSLALHDGRPHFDSYQLSTVKLLRRRLPQMRESVPGWKSTWLQFAEDGGGNGFVVDVKGGPVLRYEIAGAGTAVGICEWPARYGSYAAWLAAFRDDLLAGRGLVDEEGFVTIKR